MQNAIQKYIGQRRKFLQGKAPPFFQDLNLDRITERIRLDWGEEISSFYHYFPENGDCGDYRREVLADIKEAGLYEPLCTFCKAMKRRREAAAAKGAVELRLQRAVWHIRETGYYCDAFAGLFQGLLGKELHSRGMSAFREYLGAYLAGDFFGNLQEESRKLLEDMKAFRLVLTYENDRITISCGETEGRYDAFLEKLFPGKKEKLRSPFEAEPELADLERELLKAFRKRNPEFFEAAERFYGEYGEYADDKLIRFASEIGFYLSFLCFSGRMRERGFCFATPKIIDRFPEWGAGNSPGQASSVREAGTEEQPENLETAYQDAEPAVEEQPEILEAACGAEMSAVGLYDLALACTGREVVTNDMFFKEQERFFVLTGPNQGGKTTFARSLGQLVYFSMMGLDVPAVSARVYRFPDILTHFSVEESVETGRGKLKEELTRLAPMMKDLGGRHAFVVINELFTTAANYDACIMGRRVLEHFLDKGCFGIYVTHLGDLSGKDGRVAALQAMVDDRGVQNFKIARSSTRSRTNAVNLVSKHGLSYERLKERLS